MDQRALLRKTITLAKTGDVEAFENFYILTVEDTYAKIRNAVKDGSSAEEILIDTYVMLYRHVHELPLGADALEERVDREIIRCIYKRMGLEVGDLCSDRKYPGITEDRAATLLLWIEEKIGTSKEKPVKRNNSLLSDFVNAGRILLTVIIIGVTVFVIYKGYHLLIGQDDSKTADAAAVQSQTAMPDSTAGDIKIEEERLTPGFEQKPDGNLYYVTKNGVLAQQSLTLGKQILTFSFDGKLTLIGDNGTVSEDPNLSFDESIRYEVKNGDVYQKNMADNNQETSVTKNGHVVQADARCGYLWYICKYQVPNSSQVKTTIYRSDLNGDNEEELYTTDSTLNTEQFQLTDEWMYYISDGMLLRMNLKDGSVELMADQVAHYFAWENTAYYMKDRSLEHVLTGVDYSGIEAGYKIEMLESGFVLLDLRGETVTPDVNGEKQVGDRIYTISEGIITSVRPAEAENSGVTYFINPAGNDRKIYSKNSTGSQSLVRQDGIVADSLCIAGEWLYYSARVESYDGEAASQIFRLNLQTLESEEVGDGFEGYMKNMYYFDDLQSIFAEYVPSVADPYSIQGKIALIPVVGLPNSLDERPFLPAGDEAYMLEFVSADATRVYCLYHTYLYDETTGQTEWTSSVPMEIKYK